jgi:putative restriction endonuclease
MKAVFTTKVGSGYDDVVEERYHFPSTYLGQVRNAIGDFIVYYEPRRQGDAPTGGRQSYFAVARLLEVEPDFELTDHYYARLDNYLDFDRPVPFRSANGYFEMALQRSDGETNRGAFGRAVRNISDDEFSAILSAGFSSVASLQIDENVIGAEIDEPEREFERPLVEITETRWFRDRAFTRHVQKAYDRTCAVTGLQIVNGGGRAEAQAAHIKPVASEGPDSVRNGIALSGTLHWMFDRGLFSVGESYEILIANGVPDRIRQIVNPTGRLLLPTDRLQWPHQHYLSYHRQNIYKG